MPLGQLVESVLTQGEPRTVLVWRKGFAGLDPGRGRPRGRAADRALPRAQGRGGGRAPGPGPPAPPRAGGPASPRASHGRQPASPVRRARHRGRGDRPRGLAAVAPLRAGGPPQVVPLGGTTAENAPAVVIPAPAARERPSPGARRATAIPPQAPPAPAAGARPRARRPRHPRPRPAPGGRRRRGEELPMAEVRKLRQVAAWSGTRARAHGGQRHGLAHHRALRARSSASSGTRSWTTRRPSSCCLPEGHGRRRGRQPPEQGRPGPQEAGGQPQRHRASSPGQAGPRPEGFRCEIVSARGYPPR